MTVPCFAYGPSKAVTIRLINGKSGKPVKNERLLILFGSSPHDVRIHTRSTDLHTDSNGEATLPLKDSTIVYLHVFADFRTFCEENSNSRIFAIEDVPREGETGS